MIVLPEHTADRLIQNRGVCGRLSPAYVDRVFFAERDQPKVESEAKAICTQCPIQAVCLEWALATRQDLRIWGGLTSGERIGLAAARAGRPTARPAGARY